MKQNNENCFAEKENGWYDQVTGSHVRRGNKENKEVKFNLRPEWQ